MVLWFWVHPFWSFLSNCRHTTNTTVQLWPAQWRFLVSSSSAWLLVLSKLEVTIPKKKECWNYRYELYIVRKLFISWSEIMWSRLFFLFILQLDTLTSHLKCCLTWSAHLWMQTLKLKQHGDDNNMLVWSKQGWFLSMSKS